MDVELLYFDGCPYWQTAADRLQVAPQFGAVVREHDVTGDQDADLLGFAGSPTILINGHDAFPFGTPTRVLSCRLYQMLEGVAGSPTIEQIRAVMEADRALRRD